MKIPKIPKKLAQHWIIDKGRIFASIYLYGRKNCIFKFCYQPESGELLFDIPYTHHKMMILNYGKGKFDDYIRGICFWDKQTIYLRGHEKEDWLERTAKMLRQQGISKDIRIVWGVKVAEEFREELRGL
ncbi:MAG: hypothetical protein FJZ16_10160 [Candidatus Omnitrophica bacterium]|nr:hypothetical protein [Candidatus Omnitrophota bacterium]